MENFERIDELKKERRLARRRQRAKQLLWHMVICSALILILLSVGVMYLTAEVNEQEEAKKDELTVKVETAPVVDPQFLTVNEYSRPGTKLEEVKGIVVHYTGNPGTTAMQNRNYFEGLAQSKKTKASSHYIIGLSGEIIQCIPLDEISYASNQRNVDTISIECCIDNEMGKFNEKTYESLVQLTAWLVGEYDLKISDIIRHYDVTGKNCPKYFVENKSAWYDFRLDVEKYIDSHGVKK